jgi:hypothetical protein
VRAWEWLWCGLVVTTASVVVTVRLTLDYERENRPKCDAQVGHWRLTASYERPDSVSCYYVMPGELWGHAVRKDIKRRKG